MSADQVVVVDIGVVGEVWCGLLTYIIHTVLALSTEPMIQYSNPSTHVCMRLCVLSIIYRMF